MTDLYLFDLDGTMADDRHRLWLYSPGQSTPYWDRDAMLADPVWEPAREAVHDALADGNVVGILSGRLDSYNRDITIEWLSANGLPSSPMFLRPDELKDIRPAKFKLSVLRTLIALGAYDKVVLIDNDPLVVEVITQELGPEYAMLCSWRVAEE